MTISDELTTLLKSQGASLVGFADLQEVPPDIRNNMPFGISIAVALNPDIIAGIQVGPNKQYFQEYQRANNLLDTLGSSAAHFLEQEGYQATSFAATNWGIDRQTLSTTLPHKTVATRAGLGWIGKCALLITREFGSAIRITTVLTSMPLTAAQPVNTSFCGDCAVCVDSCPGHAVSGNDWQAGTPRESLYNAHACHQTALEFEKVREGVYDSICGICIAVCPWTKNYLER
jgi:epoxyqueuosine reductase